MIRKKWRNTADQISEYQDRGIKFEDIVVFVEKQARAASHPVLTPQLANGNMKGKRTPTPNQRGKALQSKGTIPTREETMKPWGTPLVKGMEIQRTVQSVQGIIICTTIPNLKGSLCGERAQFVKSKSLCFNCLKPYHRVQDCRKKGACKDCGRKHSPLFPHPPVAGGNANKKNPAGKQQENPALQGREPAVPKVNNGFVEVEPALCGFTGMSKETVGLPVATRCVKPVITYAFFKQWFQFNILHRGPTKSVRAEG